MGENCKNTLDVTSVSSPAFPTLKCHMNYSILILNKL